jgi:hypothetical protein
MVSFTLKVRLPKAASPGKYPLMKGVLKEVRQANQPKSPYVFCDAQGLGFGT